MNWEEKMGESWLSKNTISDYINVTAIRILPMSEDDPEFTGKSTEDLQEWFQENLPNRNYNFKRGMNTPSGTLVLFQYKSCVIAAAILEERILYPEKTKGNYTGYYNFHPSTIAVFTPITSDEMKTVWTTFKGYNQSMQKLEVNQLASFYSLLLNKNLRYVLEDENEESFQVNVERTEMDSFIQKEDTPILPISGLNLSPSTKWMRNHLTAKKAIVHAEYRCEFDGNHMFFESFVTGENYVEAHHLIPMEYQGQFKWSLDVEANIISLCPLCHKTVHHAPMEAIEPIIKNLYHLRKVRLQKCGIDIDFNKLLTYY
jgi:5-methylcytosine-specific restriction enzyme A